jgi:hypothetical protein
VSNSTRLYFFVGRVFDRSDSLPSLSKTISNTDNAKAYLRGVCNCSPRQYPPTGNTFTTCILQTRREVNQIWTPSFLNAKPTPALLPPSKRLLKAPHIYKINFASCLLEKQKFTLLCIYYLHCAYVLLHSQNAFPC